jgi:GNAT superfamily N-acetyltransferase
MKLIGVHQWAGADPWLAGMANDLEQLAERSRRHAQERWHRMAPSERFFERAKERFRIPQLFGVAPARWFWQIGEWTLAEIRPISLHDIADSSSFLVHLQSIYVVDAMRGQGEGKRALEQIKQLAEECGCGVTLFAKSFALSRDEELPNAVQTFDELVRAALEEEWPVLYQPDWDAECLRLFYASCGWVNMCLYGPWVYGRPKEEDLPFDRQFAYLPQSMAPAHRSRLAGRLNPDLCEYCNR